MALNKVSLFIILVLLSQVQALKILAIISLPLSSHYMAFTSFFHELANRGHHVTVINYFPDKGAPSNLRYITLPHKQNYTRMSLAYLEDYEREDSYYRRWSDFYIHIKTGSLNVKYDCENLFTSEVMKDHLLEGDVYDVIFVEQFMSDCGLSYALSLYSAPVIGINSHVLLPLAYPRLALTHNLAADAYYFSDVGPRPSLLKKLEIFITDVLFMTIGRWHLHRSIYDTFDRFLPNHTLDIERDARARIKMMFSYQHFSLTGARPLSPQILEIGGIHVGVPKPVAKEIEQFLSDADHGAIYVSFGTNLKASTMSKKKLEQFLSAFRRLPYKVIWKFENATFTEKKILTGNWFSQLDVLCHPKVLAFVAHGGMLGISETTHCGKPILTIPFFGDQFSNAAAVRSVGLGKTLYFDKLDADNLEATIRELTSPEMQQNAKRISALWHDRPMPVMDSAIYWTEYVARHKTSPPPLPASFNSWFENMLLDVYSVLVVLLILIYLVISGIVKFMLFILKRLLRLFGLSKVKKE